MKVVLCGHKADLCPKQLQALRGIFAWSSFGVSVHGDWGLVVLWGQMYVIGCLKKGQHGSRST